MDPRTAEEVDSIIAAPLGFYLQADLVVRLMTRENVDEVMAHLPPAFREELVAFARGAYLPDDERIVVAGEAMPVSCFDAVGVWFRQAKAVGAAGRGPRAGPG